MSKEIKILLWIAVIFITAIIGVKMAQGYSESQSKKEMIEQQIRDIQSQKHSLEILQDKYYIPY